MYVQFVLYLRFSVLLYTALDTVQFVLEIYNTAPYTVEHTYDACPKYSELGSFRIKAYIFMLATIAAADSASTIRKKYKVFIYSEAEPHAVYAIYKQTRKLCVLQYGLICD